MQGTLYLFVLETVTEKSNSLMTRLGLAGFSLGENSSTELVIGLDTVDH
jgi:hypothetical protein